MHGAVNKAGPWLLLFVCTVALVFIAGKRESIKNGLYVPTKMLKHDKALVSALKKVRPFFHSTKYTVTKSFRKLIRDLDAACEDPSVYERGELLKTAGQLAASNKVNMDEVFSILNRKRMDASTNTN